VIIPALAESDDRKLLMVKRCKGTFAGGDEGWGRDEVL